MQRGDTDQAVTMAAMATEAPSATAEGRPPDKDTAMFATGPSFPANPVTNASSMSQNFSKDSLSSLVDSRNSTLDFSEEEYSSDDEEGLDGDESFDSSSSPVMNENWSTSNSQGGSVSMGISSNAKGGFDKVTGFGLHSQNSQKSAAEGKLHDFSAQRPSSREGSQILHPQPNRAIVKPQISPSMAASVGSMRQGLPAMQGMPVRRSSSDKAKAAENKLEAIVQEALAKAKKLSSNPAKCAPGAQPPAQQKAPQGLTEAERLIQQRALAQLGKPLQPQQENQEAVEKKSLVQAQESRKSEEARMQQLALLEKLSQKKKLALEQEEQKQRLAQQRSFNSPFGQQGMPSIEDMSPDEWDTEDEMLGNEKPSDFSGDSEDSYIDSEDEEAWARYVQKAKAQMDLVAGIEQQAKGNVPVAKNQVGNTALPPQQSRGEASLAKEQVALAPPTEQSKVKTSKEEYQRDSSSLPQLQTKGKVPQSRDKVNVIAELQGRSQEKDKMDDKLLAQNIVQQVLDANRDRLDQKSTGNRDSPLLTPDHRSSPIGLHQSSQMWDKAKPVKPLTEMEEFVRQSPVFNKPLSHEDSDLNVKFANRPQHWSEMERDPVLPLQSSAPMVSTEQGLMSTNSGRVSGLNTARASIAASDSALKTSMPACENNASFSSDRGENIVQRESPDPSKRQVLGEAELQKLVQERVQALKHTPKITPSKAEPPEKIVKSKAKAKKTVDTSKTASLPKKKADSGSSSSGKSKKEPPPPKASQKKASVMKETFQRKAAAGLEHKRPPRDLSRVESLPTVPAPMTVDQMYAASLQKIINTSQKSTKVQNTQQSDSNATVGSVPKPSQVKRQVHSISSSESDSEAKSESESEVEMPKVENATDSKKSTSEKPKEESLSELTKAEVKIDDHLKHEKEVKEVEKGTKDEPTLQLTTKTEEKIELKESDKPEVPEDSDKDYEESDETDETDESDDSDESEESEDLTSSEEESDDEIVDINASDGMEENKQDSSSSLTNSHEKGENEVRAADPLIQEEVKVPVMPQTCDLPMPILTLESELDLGDSMGPHKSPSPLPMQQQDMAGPSTIKEVPKAHSTASKSSEARAHKDKEPATVLSSGDEMYDEEDGWPVDCLGEERPPSDEELVNLEEEADGEDEDEELEEIARGEQDKQGADRPSTKSRKDCGELSTPELPITPPPGPTIPQALQDELDAVEAKAEPSTDTPEGKKGAKKTGKKRKKKGEKNADENQEGTEGKPKKKRRKKAAAGKKKKVPTATLR